MMLEGRRGRYPIVADGQRRFQITLFFMSVDVVGGYWKYPLVVTQL